MRAVVFEEVGRVRVADVPEPQLKDPSSAIVRVTLSAICGSDLHILHGKTPIETGQGIGHEAVGVVEAIGPDVEEVAVGDRVVVAFTSVCGRCWFCLKGQTQLCETVGAFGSGAFGGSMPGAQAEMVLVPAADVNLLPIPSGVEDDKAIFVGDVLTTGVYAAELAEAGPGRTIAIVGAGPVGFFSAQASIAAGADCVAVVDPVESRLNLAEMVGAVPVDPGRVHPATALAGLTEGRGADSAIDAVGRPEAFERAVGLVRRGGIVAVIGVYAGETIELQLGAYWARALDIRFSGLCPVQAHWRRAMQLVVDGVIDPAPLISHRMPLADAPSGYELFDRGDATKVVLVP